LVREGRDQLNLLIGGGLHFIPSQRDRTEWSTMPQKGNHKDIAMTKFSDHCA